LKPEDLEGASKSFDSIWNRAKAATTLSREADRHFYEQVAQELQQGIRDDGVWLMAFERAEGDDARAKAYYIGLRVQRLKDNENIRSGTERNDHAPPAGAATRDSDRNAQLSCPYCNSSFSTPFVVCPSCSRVIKA
jgi:hypothetical protein